MPMKDLRLDGQDLKRHSEGSKSLLKLIFAVVIGTGWLKSKFDFDDFKWFYF